MPKFIEFFVQALSGFRALGLNLKDYHFEIDFNPLSDDDAEVIVTIKKGSEIVSERRFDLWPG